MSKKLLAPGIIFLFAIFTTSVLAQEAGSSTTPAGTTTGAVLTQAAERKTAILTQGASRKETAASKAAERKEQIQTTTIQNLQTKATKEIERRIVSLSRLVSKVNDLKRVTSDQKAALTSQIQTEITNLTNLKAKIQADTDLTTLRTDVKSIVASYRIYALFIPKINILTAGDALLNATDKLLNVHTDLSQRIVTAKSGGADTTQAETTLAQMKAKIDDAIVQTNSAIAIVTPLTPEGYPGNTTALSNARKALAAARKDVAEASHLAREALKLLRSKPGTTPVVSPSQTEPTPTPSPIP